MAQGGRNGSHESLSLAPLDQLGEEPLDATGAMREPRTFQLGTERLRDRPSVTCRFVGGRREGPARIDQPLAYSTRTGHLDSLVRGQAQAMGKHR